MEVVSNVPFRIAQLRWILSGGAPALTVILKATYLLHPVEAVLAPEQEAPQEEDSYWNDDPQKSLSSSTDLVPFKQYPEVVLVGHAFAPRGQPVRSLVARLVVGNVHKAIEVYGERSFALDGHLEEGAPFTKMRLSYERAAASEASNPVGIRFDVQDAYGRTRLPNLQPQGVFVARRGDVFAPIGFGPLSPSWPERRARAQHATPAFDPRGWTQRPFPDRVAPSYFNAAPLDQRLEGLHPNERITLENLLPDHPRLTTSLPGLEPQGTVERPGQSATKLTLACDTLWIDTDRQICHLVWRGTVALSREDEPGKIVLATAASARGTVASAPAISEDPSSTTIAPFAGAGMGLALPFAGGPREGGRESVGRTQTGDAALPFHGAGAPPRRGPSSTPGVPTSEVVDGTLYLEMPLAGQPPVTAPLPAPPDLVIGPPPVASHWSAGVESPPEKKGSIGERLAAEQAMGESRALQQKAGRAEPELLGPLQKFAPELPAGQAGNSGAHAVIDGAAGSAVAASNAAAQAHVRENPARLFLGNAPIELLWLSPGSLGRIRRQAAWKELLSGVKPRPEDEDQDDEIPPARRIPAKDRRDVLTVLSRGEPLDPSAVEDALRKALEDDLGFSPPLVLSAGEMEMRFDELESLKALLAALSPHTAGDKRLEEAVLKVQETLKMPWTQGASSVLDETADSLRRQFTEARKGAFPAAIDTHVERTVLDGRHFRKRTVFGQPRLSASLRAPGTKVILPVYLPDTLAKELPAIRRIPVRLIAEVRPRAEQGETSEAALRVLSLGRVLGAGR